MNAHNNVRRSSHFRLAARLVLAALQLRFAAQVDRLVARWLQRCTADIEAAQRWFEPDRKPNREFAVGLKLVVSSPHWDESA